jgi:4-hydroxy-tetrahydrodipicolinate synthase
MRYNNPATSGVDMSPELLMRMFETIDNVSMVKEFTGGLFRMQRIDELSGGRLRFYNGSNPLVLNALQAGATGSCTAALCLRPQPASTCMRRYTRTKHQQRKPFTLRSGRCWSSS